MAEGAFSTVAVHIEGGKRSAVLIEIESGSAGDFVESPSPVVSEQHVPLPAGNGLVHEQLVDGSPRVVVRRARLVARDRAGVTRQ